MEAIGLEAPFIDLEVIKLAYNFLQELGIENLTLAINSIGSAASREAYRQQLLAFLSEYQEDVCDDCKRRMQQNPLRVLDCKVPEDQAIYKNAPLIQDSFDEESKQIFMQMKAGLEALEISYTIDSSLVRGLDYYSHCVFEFKTDDKGLGQQSTVLAGGRYDNLISELGGVSSPAVGWALGMERIAYLLEAKKFPETKRIYIISDSAIEASKLAHRLRFDAKVLVEYDFEEAKVAKQMNKALKRNASHGIFYLEDERKSGSYLVKDFQAKTELSVTSYTELLSFFAGDSL
jgi:histidyl-tRNA synthetase